MNTYLIIGAGPGIGLASAQKFASQGYKVVLGARSEKRLQEAIGSLRESGAAVRFEPVDAGDAEAVKNLIEKYRDDLKVLHYNAGVLHYDASGSLEAAPLDSNTVARLSNEMNVNLTSALVAIKAAKDVFGTRGGSILLTGGGFGVEPNANFINMSVAKAGIRAAAKALFEPLRAQNIHLATVTVSTLVSAYSDKSKEIGEKFWSLHNQPESSAWDWESVIA
ncbi:SDR family NAD(P)-dependent oxidoreductase [Burkholderia cepacia]|uniref:SDR family NAD(P)-dependent oxidoreductase n=1 Tax=Burkholderia cepacia TaxID=292 RepID=UPI0029904D79|nr:SDR family NAD(P)-dependent oxidoreductase [Burkholderia cepacia]MDW9247254.1 3-hydroxyacyl-CoA dehydrogenase, NAD binding domain protein [Burkholderia cepacia]